MRLIAIDPGTTESAFLVWSGERIEEKGIVPNAELLRRLRSDFAPELLLAIEQVESYGMAVGREIFETCFWGGRFAEAHAGRGGSFRMVPRKIPKMHLCHSMSAKDSNIRQALINRFGGIHGEKRIAIGIKAAPGPLYGVVSDEWAALAIAVSISDECDALPLRPNVYLPSKTEDAA